MTVVATSIGPGGIEIYLAALRGPPARTLQSDLVELKYERRKRTAGLPKGLQSDLVELKCERVIHHVGAVGDFNRTWWN